jgi:hypothetical protein
MDVSPLLGSAVLTAVITVFGTIWVARSRAKIDIGTTITSGFRELTDQLQEERNQLSELISRQRDELSSAGKLIGEQERDMRRMRRHVALLESRMEKAGLEVPRDRSA